MEILCLFGGKKKKMKCDGFPLWVSDGTGKCLLLTQQQRLQIYGFSAFAILQRRHLLPHEAVYLRSRVYIPPRHLWLIAGIWCYSFSIASPSCLRAWRRSSPRQALQSWQAPRVFTRLLKTSKLFIYFHLGFLLQACLFCLLLQA